MKKILSLFLVVLIFATTPVVSYAQNTKTETDLLVQIAELTKLLTSLQSQLATLKSQSDASVTAQTIVSSNSTEWEFVRPYSSVIVTEKSEDSVLVLDEWDDLTVFTLKEGEAIRKNEEQVNGIKDPDSLVLWELFVKVAGQEFVKDHLLEYMTYNLSEESTLAFVEYFRETDAPWVAYKRASTQEDGTATFVKHKTGWGLAVNVGKVDFSNTEKTRENVITILHEYAHLLTLNKEQVDYTMSSYNTRIAAQRCKKINRFFMPLPVSGGCARGDSYLQAFVDRFWSDRNADNANNFVTEYASINQKEDIAESFTNFVLQRKPTVANDVSDEKLLFFYEYPELITLRDRIRADIAEYFD